MSEASKRQSVPFNVPLARELTTFEKQAGLEQALKWRLNEACDEIERLVEQLEAVKKYARHRGDCEIMQAPYLGREGVGAACTCGLWEAMGEVSSPAKNPLRKPRRSSECTTASDH